MFMKFLGVVLGCLLATAAQADFLTGALNMAAAKADYDKKVEAKANELVQAALQIKQSNEDKARADANILLDEAAKLSVLAQASNSGLGKDLSYAESDLNEKLPCGADLFATKDGVATLTLGKTCDQNISPVDVRRQVEKLGADKIYCEKNICQIDFKVRNPK